LGLAFNVTDPSPANGADTERENLSSFTEPLPPTTTCEDGRSRRCANASVRAKNTTRTTLYKYSTIYIYTRDTVVVVARARARAPPPPSRAHARTRNPYNPPIAFSRDRHPRDSRLAQPRAASIDHTRTRPDMLTVAEFIFEKKVVLVYEVTCAVVRSRKRASV